MLPYTEQFALVGPDDLVFGRGVVEQTGERADEHGTSALVVTDPGIRRAGLLDAVLDSLSGAGLDVSVFDEVEPDPTVSTVVACAERAREVDAEVLVGVGGGSSMDVAKGAAALATSDRPVEALLGRGNVETRGLPTILLPTTAGTGAEVSPAVVLFDDLRTGEKVAMIDDALFATTALVDPDLTMHLPAPLTRATGLDAFAHAMGSYMATTSNTFANALCAEAMDLIETHLRDAVYHGANAPGAREKLSLAATMAMFGRVNGGKAAIHSVAYGIQAMYDVPHAEAIAMVLPETVEYNLPAATGAFARLGTRLYGAEGSRRERAETLVEGVYRLRDDVGLDRSLRSVGASESDLDELAELATHSERHLEANPRPVTVEDAKEILLKLW